MLRELLAVLLTIACLSTSLLLSTSALGSESNDKITATAHNDYMKQMRETRHCDRQSCGSIVAKCNRTKRCSCNFKKDAHCAKDCLDCLGDRFGRCCACVHLCPPIQDDGSHSSHVGDINETSYDELFEVLTETDDIHGRWSVATGSASKEFQHPELGRVRIGLDGRKKVVAEPQQDLMGGDWLNWTNNGDNTDDFESRIDQNFRSTCNVAFINKRLSLSQCKRYCQSMGASSFRWFHDGCCECVGKSCIQYGIDRPKCYIEND